MNSNCPSVSISWVGRIIDVCHHNEPQRCLSSSWLLWHLNNTRLRTSKHLYKAPKCELCARSLWHSEWQMHQVTFLRNNHLLCPTKCVIKVTVQRMADLSLQDLDPPTSSIFFFFTLTLLHIFWPIFGSSIRSLFGSFGPFCLGSFLSSVSKMILLLLLWWKQANLFQILYKAQLVLIHSDLSLPYLTFLQQSEDRLSYSTANDWWVLCSHVSPQASPIILQ